MLFACRRNLGCLSRSLSLDNSRVLAVEALEVRRLLASIPAARFSPVGIVDEIEYGGYCRSTLIASESIASDEKFTAMLSDPLAGTSIIGVAPKVESVTFGDGTAQRSMVQKVKVNFDTIVTILPEAFELARGGGLGFAAIPAADLAIIVATSVVSGKTVAELTFSSTSTFIQGGSLPDGNYRLAIQSNLVTAGGLDLDGDNNGTAGGNYVIGAVEADGFFRRFGDSDGNRTTRLAELGQLRAAIGKALPDPGYDPRFDFNSNGTVALSELDQLRARINARLDF